MVVVLPGKAGCREPAGWHGSAACTAPARAQPCGCPCMAAVGPGCPQPGLLPGSPGSSPCLVTAHPERAGTSCGSGISPPIKASYLCSFPCALNFAYVSGKRAAALGQSTASSQRGESAFNFSSDFPSLFSLIPPAITE